MALINCPECGKEISDQAKECRYCGYPIKPKKKTANIKIIGGILAFIFIIMIIVFVVARPHKLHPYEINYDNEIISYYESEDEISRLPSSIEITSRFGFWDDSYPINIYIYNNEIRAINIQTKDASVYGNISVGDNISKIEDTFDYVQEAGNELYTVLFSDDNEINEAIEDYNDNNLYIYFYSENNIIDRITILDAKCAFTAR